MIDMNMCAQKRNVRRQPVELQSMRSAVMHIEEASQRLLHSKSLRRLAKPSPMIDPMTDGRCGRAQVHLWDVTTASVIAVFGAVDFAAKQRELFRPVSVPSWFTCETSSGVRVDP